MFNDATLVIYQLAVAAVVTSTLRADSVILALVLAALALTAVAGGAEFPADRVLENLEARASHGHT